MEINNEFIELIKHADLTIRELIKSGRQELFKNRYNQILDNLNDLHNAFDNNTLYSAFIYLEITQMIDQNDPEELREAILDINKFYCSNYRKI